MKKNIIIQIVENYRKTKADARQPLDVRIECLLAYLKSSPIQSLPAEAHLDYYDFYRFIGTLDHSPGVKHRPNKMFDAEYFIKQSSTVALFKQFKTESMEPPPAPAARAIEPPGEPPPEPARETPSSKKVVWDASQLTADNYDFEEEEVTITGDLPDRCHIRVPNGSLTIEGQVGKECGLEALLNIAIRKTLQESSAALSHGGEVSIGGNVEPNCNISGINVNVKGRVNGALVTAQEQIEIDKGYDRLSEISAPVVIAKMVEETPQETIATNRELDHQLEQNLDAILTEQAIEVSRAKFVVAYLYELRSLPDQPPLIQQALQNMHKALFDPKHPAHQTLLRDPRPHQLNFYIEYHNALIMNIPNVVVAQATGSGKTVEAAVITALMANNGREVSNCKFLFLAPKKILIEQAHEKFKKFAPQLKVANYVPGALDADADVITTTPQLLWIGNDTRLERMEKTIDGRSIPLKNHFSFAFFDEAHNLLGEVGIKKIVQVLLDAKVACIALTATPIIDAKKAKPGETIINSCYQLFGYESIAQNPITPFTFVMAEELGQLAPVVSGIVTPTLGQQMSEELKKLMGGQSVGEVDENKVGRLINTEANNRMIVDIFANGINHRNQERFLSKIGITFAAGVNHAEDLRNAYNHFIPVENNAFLCALRERYVNNVYKRELEVYLKEMKHFFHKTYKEEKARLGFDKRFKEKRANELRQQFKVAEALHAGQYSVYLTKDEAQKAAADGKVRYQNKSTGEWKTATLKPAELNKLKNKFEKHKKEYNHPYKVVVGEKISDQEKADILQQYAEGGILMLVGADMLIEGFDNSKTKFMICARPTRSHKTLTQMIGRVVRPDEGMAVVICVNLGVLGQQFFYHVADNRWELGNLANVAPVNHGAIATIDVPGKTLTGGIAWQQTTGLLLQEAAAKASAGVSKQSRVVKDKELSLNRMIEEVSKVMGDLSGVISKLDDRLGQATHIEKAEQPEQPEAEPEEEKPRKQAKKTGKPRREPQIYFNARSPMTDGFTLRLQKLMAKAETMNDQLQRILDDIEAVAAKDHPPKAKRAKTTSDSTDSPLAKPAKERLPNESDQEAKSLLAAVAHLRGLKDKLDQIASGAINAPGAGAASAMPVSDTTTDPTLAADFTRIQNNLARLSHELNQTTENFNVEQINKIAENVEAARKAKQEAALVAKVLPHKPVTAPTAPVNPSATQPIPPRPPPVITIPDDKPAPMDASPLRFLEEEDEVPLLLPAQPSIASASPDLFASPPMLSETKGMSIEEIDKQLNEIGEMMKVDDSHGILQLVQAKPELLTAIGSEDSSLLRFATRNTRIATLLFRSGEEIKILSHENVKYKVRLYAINNRNKTFLDTYKTELSVRPLQLLFNAISRVNILPVYLLAEDAKKLLESKNRIINDSFKDFVHINLFIYLLTSGNELMFVDKNGLDVFSTFPPEQLSTLESYLNIIRAKKAGFVVQKPDKAAYLTVLYTYSNTELFKLLLHHPELASEIDDELGSPYFKLSLANDYDRERLAILKGFNVSTDYSHKNGSLSVINYIQSLQNPDITELFRLLISLNVPLQKTDAKGQTAYKAIYMQQNHKPQSITEIAVWLRNSGIPIASPDKIAEFKLFMKQAINEEGCKVLYYQLRNNPMLLGIRDAAGNTPLHEAVAWANQYPVYNRLVIALVFFWADINAKNDNGKTPLDLAHPEVKQLITTSTIFYSPTAQAPASATIAAAPPSAPVAPPLVKAVPKAPENLGLSYEELRYANLPNELKRRHNPESSFTRLWLIDNISRLQPFCYKHIQYVIPEKSPVNRSLLTSLNNRKDTIMHNLACINNRDLLLFLICRCLRHALDIYTKNKEQKDFTAYLSEEAKKTLAPYLNAITKEPSQIDEAALRKNLSVTIDNRDPTSMLSVLSSLPTANLVNREPGHLGLFPLEELILSYCRNPIQDYRFIILLGFGAKLSQVSNDMPLLHRLAYTAIRISSQTPTEEYAKAIVNLYYYLVTLGCDPTQKDAQRQTAISALLKIDKFREAYYKRLLQEEPNLQFVNAPITSEDINEKHAIYEAIRSRNDAKMLNLIRENPRLVFLKDASGNTPLHCACNLLQIDFTNRAFWVTLIPRLIYLGSDPSIANNVGVTPLQSSISLGIQQVWVNFKSNPAGCANLILTGRDQMVTPPISQAPSAAQPTTKRTQPEAPTQPNPATLYAQPKKPKPAEQLKQQPSANETLKPPAPLTFDQPEAPEEDIIDAIFKSLQDPDDKSKPSL